MLFLCLNNFLDLPIAFRFQSKLLIIRPLPFCSISLSKPLLSAFSTLSVKHSFVHSIIGPFFHLLTKLLLATNMGQALCLRLGYEAVSRRDP